MSPVEAASDRPLENVSRRPPAHVRTIQIAGVDLDELEGERFLRVHGVLEDRRPRGVPDWLAHDGDVIHHMEVTLTVGYPDLVIRAIDGSMATFPHTGICPDALPPLQSLVGVSVTRGFTRAVNERIGRERGCTHIAALILAMGPVVRQAAGAAFGFGSRPRPGASPQVVPQATAQVSPWFINSCQAWREGGVLHTQWLAGRLDRRG